MKFCRAYWSFTYKLQIFFLVNLICSSMICALRTQRVRSRLCSAVNISNALVRFRHNYKIMRIVCARGFTLQGNNIIGCENGKWNAALPVCAKEGCTKLKNPSNGIIISTQFTATLYCKEGYRTVGGKITYCNGTDWDRPLGECKETRNITQMFCDFETDDLCGWSQDEFHNFDWKRVMAANMFQQVRTGPQHDHTTFTANAGHYMLLESFDQLPHSIARLISPVYSSNVTQKSCCFRFYYFMYGATVGSLNVYVKPVTVNMDKMLEDPKYLKFSLSGNQKNIWKEGLFTIDEMQEDFQLVIEGSAGSNHLSDIAIDDVHLMKHSECQPDGTTSTTNLMDYTDNAIYDVQSCEGRCGESNSSGYGIKNIDGKFYKLCDCHMECESLSTCCPNFEAICEFEKNTDPPQTSTTISVVKSSTTYDDMVFKTTDVSLTPGNTMHTVPNSLTSTIANKIKPTYENIKQTTPITMTVPTNHFKEERNTIIMRKTKETMSTLETNVPSTIIPFTTDSNTTTELVLTTEDFVITSSSTGTTNDKELSSKAKVITWEMNHNLNRKEKSAVLFIFTVIIFMSSVFLFLGILSKCLRSLKVNWLRNRQQNSWNEYCEKTTLTYRQNNDIILQSK